MKVINITIRTGALAAILFNLSACSNALDINRGKAAPVVATSLGDKYHTLATTAERRLVISKIDEKTGTALACAEPSPDAIEALGASVSAALDASGGLEGKGSAALKSEYYRGLTTGVGALTRRSQGGQFFRDGTFFICQGSLNGLQRGDEILAAFNRLMDVSAKLILEEIRNPNWYDLPSVAAPVPTAAIPDAEASRSATTPPA